MNDRQSTNIPDDRNSQTDTAMAPESFVLHRGVADRASISEGAIYLLLPTGEYARVEVPREDVARVARVLLGRPAVLLLAHDAPLPALAEASGPAPVDTGLPGTVAFANRLRDLARTMHPSNFRSDLFALADDLSNAPDPCKGYPSAETVLRTCDAVIAELNRGAATLAAAACQGLRDRLAKVMAARPAQASAPLSRDAGDDVGTLAQQLHDAHRHRDYVEVPRIIKALDDIAEAARKAPARTRSYADGLRDAIDAVTRVPHDGSASAFAVTEDHRNAIFALLGIAPEYVAPKTYADGLRDASLAVARVALSFDPHHTARRGAERAQDALAALQHGTEPPVLFDPALHLVRADVLTALESALDACTHDHPVLAGLLARFRTASEAA